MIKKKKRAVMNFTDALGNKYKCYLPRGWRRLRKGEMIKGTSRTVKYYRPLVNRFIINDSNGRITSLHYPHIVKKNT